MEKLKISKMTGKLEGLAGVNTSPLDNKFCEAMSQTDKVCKECYSRKMLKTSRKNCRPAWQHNGEILANTSSFIIPKIRENTVRFHAHGELENKLHYENFIRIAKAYPEKTFTLWTKRKELIKGIEKPGNLILIYSDPDINGNCEIPQGFDKVFHVYDHDNGKINCGKKKCRDCMICYSGNSITHIYELLK